MAQLAGRVAIVTGASRGSGRAAAVALAREGLSVMLAARDEAMAAELAREIAKAGGKAAALGCDVSDYAAVEKLVGVLRRRRGHGRRVRRVAGP